ncbi:MAG TPA: hypothetical protein VMU76_00395 [Acidimicrobiales bacterium]|nr:hypothetical protein [Acidimicrobiales bacterium]
MADLGIAVEVEGRVLTLTNLDKVLFPATGTTKRELCRYYTQIAPTMLPHLKDRPVTFRRAPDGTGGKAFFQKHRPPGSPAWVPTIDVDPSGPAGRSRRGGPDATRGNGAERIPFAAVDSLPALLWAANLAAIELHVPMWRVDRRMVPKPPDLMVFDLDPGPRATMLDCCEVALLVRDELGGDGLTVLPKTSGSKGLQLYVAIGDRPAIDSLHYARELARHLERLHPATVVSNMRRDLRTGKVLIDWSQNHPAKTTVAPYSLRVRPEPSVSTPVVWDEVAAALRSGDTGLLSFTPDDVLDRVRAQGDLFQPLAG